MGRPARRRVHPGLTGRTAAAPLLFDAFARISRSAAHALPAAPAGTLNVAATDLPPPLKRFREARDDAHAAGAFLEPAVQIAFPPDRSELDVEDGDGAGIVVKAEGGALPLTWLVDGMPIASDPPGARPSCRPAAAVSSSSP